MSRRELYHNGTIVRAFEESGVRFLRATEDDMYLSSNDADEKAVTMVTDKLFDQIPRFQLETSSLPDPEELIGLSILMAERGDPDPLMERWLLTPEGDEAAIYFIIFAEVGAIKVGYSANLESRLNSYKSHFPGELEIHQMPGNRRVESEILQAFAPILIKGREWFWPHPALINYIHGCVG